MAEGFNLELQDYCSYCGYFKPEIRKIDGTCLCDSTYGGRTFMTTIKCENAEKCARIYQSLKERECNQ